MTQEKISQQTNKQTPSSHVAQQKKIKRQQEYKKQALQNKKKWMPFLKYLKKQGLKLKTARCGKVRIQYFRTDEVQQILSKNRNAIEKDTALKQFRRTWEKQVIYFNRPQHITKLKYPKQLQKSEKNAKSKFASFKFDSLEPKTWLFSAILAAIIAVVLFPLWPYMLKYAIFIICLYLVILIVGLIVLRLVLYLIGAIFGVSFWFLPNFFGDYSVIQSFLPVYSVSKWQSGFFSTVGRVLALFVIGYYSYHLCLDLSWVFENIEITKTSFDDLHDWGVGKIKGQKNFSQSALTNLDHIMNQTAEIYVDQSIDLGSSQNEENDQQNSQSQQNEQTLDQQYNQILQQNEA